MKIPARSLRTSWRGKGGEKGKGPERSRVERKSRPWPRERTGIPKRVAKQCSACGFFCLLVGLGNAEPLLGRVSHGRSRGARPLPAGQKGRGSTQLEVGRTRLGSGRRMPESALGIEQVQTGLPRERQGSVCKDLAPMRLVMLRRSIGK